MSSLPGQSKRTARPGMGRIQTVLVCGLLLLSACSPAAAQVESAVPTETRTARATTTKPAVPTAALLPPILTATLALPERAPETATAAPVVPCEQDLCYIPGALFLRRPIRVETSFGETNSGSSGNDVVDATYPFGSTQSGMRDPHHGVEFLNRFGTPVLAAGDGVVVTAGTDIDPTSERGVWPITFYGPYSNFYGNLVVIEHSLPEALQAAFPDLNGPIYSLYGHLSEIGVHVGQQVQTGEPIGKVGMAGIATGSHLHFEVRVGENSYKASRNPELWLAPHTGEGRSEPSHGQLNGAIGGRFLDSFGNPLEMPSIVLQHLPQGQDGPSDFQVSLITYEEKGLIGQPPFQESFGVGDLPPGLYRISFPMGGLRQELVQIFPDQLTLVTFRSKE